MGAADAIAIAVGAGDSVIAVIGRVFIRCGEANAAFVPAAATGTGAGPAPATGARGKAATRYVRVLIALTIREGQQSD